MAAAGELRCVDAAIESVLEDIDSAFILKEEHRTRSLHGFVPVTPEAEAPRCAKAASRCFSLRCDRHKVLTWEWMGASCYLRLGAALKRPRWSVMKTLFTLSSATRVLSFTVSVRGGSCGTVSPASLPGQTQQLNAGASVTLKETGAKTKCLRRRLKRGAAAMDSLTSDVF
ncbi:unnamed protein product [Pleuronectes platessa]|uniref:Uncharacterized protein n=1 Tax=Pleuronectes platessa TaxID=8262 RepID=A0A9N7YJK5_PLEPL|nr:unnamed protein product [Pleuronectes platessa]